ncbi:hypothetical protein DFH09DRAFT_1078524 [Mycena vulgaris]|nr:hypothetical protein DFH09DRAFT_1078524 [Mycena vulgaris]
MDSGMPSERPPGLQKKLAANLRLIEANSHGRLVEARKAIPKKSIFSSPSCKNPVLYTFHVSGCTLHIDDDGPAATSRLTVDTKTAKRMLRNTEHLEVVPSCCTDQNPDGGVKLSYVTPQSAGPAKD